MPHDEMDEFDSLLSGFSGDKSPGQRLEEVSPSVLEELYNSMPLRPWDVAYAISLSMDNHEHRWQSLRGKTFESGWDELRLEYLMLLELNFRDIKHEIENSAS